MKNTDGLIIKKINDISEKKLLTLNFASIVLWLLSPLFMMAMNLFHISSYTFHGLLIIILYVSGCIGLIFGGIFVIRLMKKDFTDATLLIQKYLPMFMFGVFLVWCVVSTLFAEEKRVAIYGYESLRDNLLTFLFFCGLFLSGFTVLQDYNFLKLVNKITVFMFAVVGVSSLVTGKIIAISSSTFLEADSLELVYFSELIVAAIFVGILNILLSKCNFGISVFLYLYLLLEYLTLLRAGETFIILFVAVAIALFLFVVILKGTNRQKINTIIMALALLAESFVFLKFKNESFHYVLDKFINLITTRAHTWGIAISNIYDSLVVGVGPQNLFFTANSMLLQLCIYLGIPGLMIFAYLLYSNIKTITNDTAFPCALIVSFIVLLSLSASIYYINAFLFVILGIFWGANFNIKKQLD